MRDRVSTQEALAKLPIEERRRLQREAGLFTENYIEESRSNMSDQQTQQSPRARRTVEDFINTLDQGEPFTRSVKKAAAYAVVWAPVALAVGVAVMKLAGRKVASM